MANTAEAKPEAAAGSAGKDKPAKKGGTFRLIFFMVVFGAAAPFIMPTLTLLLIGMIPTLVALFTDTDKHKSSVTAVGAMNAAGVAPFVIDLWIKGQTMSEVFQIFGDSTNLLIMLGSAGIGWLIVFAVPQAVALLTFATAEARLKILRRNLDSLKESWGSDVGTTKPIDKIESGL